MKGKRARFARISGLVSGNRPGTRRGGVRSQQRLLPPVSVPQFVHAVLVFRQYRPFPNPYPLRLGIQGIRVLLFLLRRGTHYSSLFRADHPLPARFRRNGSRAVCAAYRVATACRDGAVLLSGRGAIDAPGAYAFLCRTLAESLFCGSNSHLCALGRHPQAARDTHQADSIGAFAGRLFQRACCDLCPAELVPQLPVFLFCASARLHSAPGMGLRLLASPRGSETRAFPARGGATLMATLIFLFSAAALLQFFISYCRSLIAASIKQPLSAEVRDVTGIASLASGDDFARVIQLLQLCPERPEDRGEIRAIGAYFGLLNFVRATLARIIPALVAWTEMERGQCAYFAAVALERRIAFSRDMLAQQLD